MANKFTITISAIDNATKTVKKINERFSRLTRPFTNIKRSMSQLGKEMGFEKLGKSIHNATQKARDFGGQLTNLAAPMMALVGGGTIAGLAALTAGFARAAVESRNMAESIGISTRTLSSYRGAAEMAGLASSDMDSSLKSLGETIQDAGAGRNQTALMLMNRLGVSFRRTKDGAVDVEKTLVDLSRVINNPKIKGNPHVQSLIARNFGVESLLPLLRKGPQAIKRYQAEINAVSYQKTGKSQFMGEQFHKSMTLMQTSIKGTKEAIADKLIPVMMPLVQQFTNFLVVNRELIAMSIGEFFQDVVNWVKKIDFKALLAGCKKLITSINDVVQALGGWKVILIALVGIKVAGFVAGIVSMAQALTGLLIPALNVLRNVIIVVGRAFLMNPIGLAVAAIAAAAYLIYKNWEPIKQFFTDLWAEVTDAFKGGIGGVSKLIINWSPLGLFYKSMRPVLKYFGIDLPPKFTDFGSNLIDSFVRGIKNEGNKATEAARQTGESVNNALKGGASGGLPSGLAASMTGLATGMAGMFDGLGKTGDANFDAASDRQGLTPNERLVGRAIYGQESGEGRANTSKANYAGARGPMQILEGTFNMMKSKGLIPKGYQWSNPTHSQEAGLAYIKHLSRKFGGDPRKIAAGYYSGEGVVGKGGVIGNRYDPKNPKAPSTHQYVAQVLGRMSRISNGPSREVAISAGGGRASAKDGSLPLEITLNAPLGYSATAKRSDGTVVPVKVNYAMSSQFQ